MYISAYKTARRNVQASEQDLRSQYLNLSYHNEKRRKIKLCSIEVEWTAPMPSPPIRGFILSGA